MLHCPWPRPALYGGQKCLHIAFLLLCCIIFFGLEFMCFVHNQNISDWIWIIHKPAFLEKTTCIKSSLTVRLCEGAISQVLPLLASPHFPHYYLRPTQTSNNSRGADAGNQVTYLFGAQQEPWVDIPPRGVRELRPYCLEKIHLEQFVSLSFILNKQRVSKNLN